MMTYPARWVVPISLAAAACGGSGQADVVRDDRLNGEWELALTPVRASFAKAVSGEADVRGTLVFVVNRASISVPDFSGIPQQVGTHDLRLAQLAPELGPRAGAPTAAASSARDSVRIVIDPGSGEPVLLYGIWRHDGVVGEWTAHHRAGVDQGGRFTLRRRPP